MFVAPRWLDRKLSWMEGVAAWLLIAIAIGMFSRYTFIIFAKAEKSMIERTIININTAINYKAAFSVLSGDVEYIEKLLLMNPINIMTDNISIDKLYLRNEQLDTFVGINNITSLPSNYGGVVIDDSEALLESGQWYFDQDDHIFFYKLDNSEFFNSNLTGPARIRYKISLNYQDMNQDNIFNPLEDDFKSMQLISIDEFSWSFN